MKPQPHAQSHRRWQPGARCVICGEKIYSYQAFNFDHLVPKSRGGRRGRSNKYLAHCICNAVKGDAWPFWLRDSQQRQAIRERVSAATWEKLARVWAGQAE